MKTSVLTVLSVILSIFSVSGQGTAGSGIPEIDIRINNTESSHDDYVRDFYVPCTIRLLQDIPPTSSNSLNVRLRNFTGAPSSAGQVLFASTNAPSNPGSTTLTLLNPISSAATTFYIKRRPNSSTGGDYLSSRDKDAMIEVLDMRSGQNLSVLARKAFMVTTETNIPITSTTQVIVNINETASTLDDYITWAPTKCSIRLPSGSPSDLNVIIQNISNSGRLRFASSIAGNGTASGLSVPVTLPSSGMPVHFFIAGNYGFPSAIDKDAVLEVRTQSGVLLSREAVMVRVRKNANNMSSQERGRFLSVLKTLKTNNGYQPFIAVHGVAGNEAHTGPGFLPWHRAFILDLERELQRIDPSVALPYWKFDAAAPIIFSSAFMGSKPIPGNTEVTLDDNNPIGIWGGPTSTTGIIRTTLFADGGIPVLRDETATFSWGTIYDDFDRMEGNPHGPAHTQGGSGSDDWLKTAPTAVNDPLFFLLHSNVDRLWAKWQDLRDRYDVRNSDTYSPLGAFRTTDPQFRIGHYLEDTMWPWNEATGNGRPATSPGGDLQGAYRFELVPGNRPRPRDMIDYQRITFLPPENTTINRNANSGFCYDDVPYN